MEFFVDEDITDAEALQLLEQEPPKPSGQKDKWDESRTSRILYIKQHICQYIIMKHRIFNSPV